MGSCRKAWERDNEQHVWSETDKKWRLYKNSERPTWDDVALQIAQAVSKGQSVVCIVPPQDLADVADDPETMVSWLQDVQADFSMIRLELHDQELHKAGTEFWKAHAQRQMTAAKKILSGGSPQKLFDALDAYVIWIRNQYLTVDRRLTSWGKCQIRHVEFMKDHLENVPLGMLDPMPTSCRCNYAQTLATA